MSQSLLLMLRANKQSETNNTGTTIKKVRSPVSMLHAITERPQILQIITASKEIKASITACLLLNNKVTQQKKPVNTVFKRTR